MQVAFKEAPRTGFEPVTYRLTAGRSTVELSRKACVLLERLQYTISLNFRQYFFARNLYMQQINQPQRNNQKDGQADKGNNRV